MEHSMTDNDRMALFDDSVKGFNFKKEVYI